MSRATKKRSRATERVNFPSYEKLIEAAQQMASELDPDNDGTVAIAGGLAMQMWGSPRLTADVDLIAELPDEGLGGEALTFGGIRTRAPNGVPVDIIVRSDKWKELYEAALDDAESVGEDIALDVVTPEFLLAMKMIAGRPKDDEDCRYLVLCENFDPDVAEEILEEYLGPYAVDDMRSIREEAQWLASKAEKEVKSEESEDESR